MKMYLFITILPSFLPSLMFFLFFFLIEVSLAHVTLVSGVRHSESTYLYLMLCSAQAQLLSVCRPFLY